MNPRGNNRRRQRGLALLVMVVVLIVGSTYILLKQLNSSAQRINSTAASANVLAQAKEALIKGFKLNDDQATYILDMPLRRLTKMSKLELESEQKELKATISALMTLLKSEENIKAQVSEELTAVGKSFATPRKTKISSS